MQQLVERVLIVGLGSIGARHLRIARELLPAANIRVLRRQPCSSVPEHADGCFADMSDAMAFRPDVAVIANPAPFHVSAARSLADAGAHLLVEKPLAANAEEVPQLLETCRRAGRVLLTGYNLRFLPSLQRFRELVAAETIGELWSVRTEIGQYLPDWRPGTDYREGVSARSSLGGGALLELSHELDYLRWIFGEVDWVQATVSRQSNLEIDVEDSAHLVLGFGVRDDGRRLIATVDLDLIRRDVTRLCTAIGERGSLRWNGLTGEVQQFQPGSGWQQVFRHEHKRDDSYVAEWRHFLACVAGDQTPFITGEDGLRVLRIIEAARRAARAAGRADCGDTVRIDP